MKTLLKLTLVALCAALTSCGAQYTLETPYFTWKDRVDGEIDPTISPKLPQDGLSYKGYSVNVDPDTK